MIAPGRTVGDVMGVQGIDLGLTRERWFWTPSHSSLGVNGMDGHG